MPPGGRWRGRDVKIPQIGRVVLEDDVEIGANLAIDRATLGTTRIGRGTKIDNLVQIGHNVQVGDAAVVGSQAGVSKNVPEGAIVLGAPAVPHLEFKRQLAGTARLPQLGKTLRALEERLRALEARLER